MALYPRAVPMLLPQNAPGAAGSQAIIPCLIVLHTNGGNNTLEGSYQYWFRRADGTSNSQGKEAHFQLETGSPFGKGRLGQYMDTTRRADSTGPANAFTRNGRTYGAIAIETADLLARTPPLEPNWTGLGQRQQLEDFCVWACRTHGIEPVLAYRHPAGGWNGIGYHRQYPEWNTSAHYCPGDAKAAEVPNLIAAVARRVQQGDDVPLTAADAQLVWDGPKIKATDPNFPPQSPAWWIAHIGQDVNTAVGTADQARIQASEANKKADATNAKLDEIIAALTNAGSPEVAAIVAALRPLISEEVRTALSETVLSVPTDT